MFIRIHTLLALAVLLGAALPSPSHAAPAAAVQAKEAAVPITPT